jgi:hypothetical protein
MQGSGTAFGLTNSSISDGSYTFVVSCNDSYNNFGYSSSYNFYIDTVFPQINFTSPTPASGTTQANTNIFVNLTSSDTASNISTFIDFDNSLVGWWRMDDTNGSSNSVVDYTGINNGTAQGDASQTNAGKLGKGYEFDGDGDYVNCGSDTSLLSMKNITVSAWVYLKNKSASVGIVSTYTGANQQYVMQYHSSGDEFRFRVGNGTNNKPALGGDSPNLNQWYHIVGVYNGIGVYVYVDGIFKDEDLTVTGDLDAGSADIWIGQHDPFANNGPFNGTIDDVMIFNRTLSTEEIKGLYANTSSKYLDNNFTGLIDKSYPFKAYTQDYGGNVNSTETRTVTIDTSGPAITVTNPANNSNFNISSVTFNITGSETLSWCGLSIDDTANKTMQGSGTAFGLTNSSISDGSHTFIVTCNDSYNNFGYSSSYNFYIDTVFPQINFTSPTPASGSTQANTNIFVNLTSSDTASNISTFIDFDNSLVGWWRMDDTNGSANSVLDYKGINNGTALGDASQTNAGKLGKGFEFDGSGDYIDVASIPDPALQNMTYSVWIKTNIVDSNAYGIMGWSEAADSDRLVLYQRSTNKFVVLMDTGSITNGIIVDITDALADEWFHLAVSVDRGGNLVTYSNGIQTNSTSISASASESLDPTYDFALGVYRAAGGGPDYYFNGTIDDVMVFNRSLSADEIKGLYANTSSKYLDNNFTSLVDGNHTFKAYTQDYGGNINSTETRTVTVDKSAPTITVTNPANNSNFNVSSVTFNITGSETLSWCGLSVDDTANKTMQGSGTAFGYINSSISDGSHTFIVTCNDSYNNYGSSGISNFYIDTIFPQINFTSPTPASGTTQANTNIFVNLTSSDTASNISTFIDFDNSLVGWWRMDDTNGSANSVLDYKGINNGTAQGDAVQTNAGKLGKGFEFDGSGDYVDAGNDASLDLNTTDFTISFWVKDSPATGRDIIGKWDANGGYSVSQAASKIILFFNPSGNYRYCGINQVNAWTHYIFTRNSTDAHCYINGALNDGSLSGAMSSEIGNSATNLKFADGGWYGGDFSGELDDVMIFNRSLSSEEIKGLYANTSSKYLDNNFTKLLIDRDYPFKAYTQDYGGNVNSTETRSVTVNQIPTVTLSAPAHGNVTTNRTPMFTWSGNDGGGGPSALTYEINLTCWEGGSIVSGGSVYVNKETLGTATSYIPSSYLKCLSDNNQYYNWTVRAYDGVNYSAWATERNISIQSLITISLPVNSVNFGAMNISDTEDTSDDNPAPLVLSNDGNTELNITVNFTDLWNSIANPSKYFQFKVRNLTDSCFIYDNTTTSWTNATAPGITGHAIQRLNFTSGYQTGCDNASIDINVEVPSAETVSIDNEPRSSIITFISSLAEPKQT